MIWIKYMSWGSVWLFYKELCTLFGLVKWKARLMYLIEIIEKESDRKMKKDNITPTEQRRGKGVKFERLRRITGYISVLSQFNDGKRQEEKDRVKHM